MVNGGFERLIDNFGVILIKGIGHLVVKCEFEKSSLSQLSGVASL